MLVRAHPQASLRSRLTHRTLACTHRHMLKLRLFKPKSASALQSFIAWASGMPAEFSDPRFPSYGEGREGGWRSAGGVLPGTRLQSVLVVCPNIVSKEGGNAPTPPHLTVNHAQSMRPPPHTHTHPAAHSHCSHTSGVQRLCAGPGQHHDEGHGAFWVRGRRQQEQRCQQWAKLVLGPG